MTLATRIVTDAAELARARDAWDALNARSAAGAPTLSSTWMLAWWRTFGATGGRALRAILVTDGDRLVGLAPLLVRRARDRLGVPLRRVELVATGEDEADEICSDYVGVLAEAGAEHAVAGAVAAALAGDAFGPWDELALPAMNGDAALPLLLSDALRARGFVATLAVTGVSRYIRLPRTWDEYLAALPSPRRYLVRRAERDLERWAEGSLRLARATTRGELARGMSVLAALHEERWRADGKRGVFGSPRFVAFHDAVAPALLDAGALELVWLEARGEPIAAAYNVVWDGKVSFYQSGRSMRVPKNVRPGIALHARAIRAAIEAGRREYDFLAGASRYKADLALDARPIVELRATPATLAGAARRAMGAALDELRAIRRVHAESYATFFGGYARRGTASTLVK